MNDNRPYVKLKSDDEVFGDFVEKKCGIRLSVDDTRLKDCHSGIARGVANYTKRLNFEWFSMFFVIGFAIVTLL